jgi:hypothetical protein
MKQAMFSMMAAALFASAAQAGEPLLVKFRYYGGFVVPSRNIQCEIYGDKLVIKRMLGAVHTVEEKSFKVDAALQPLLEEAKAGNVPAPTMMYKLSSPKLMYFIPGEKKVLLKEVISETRVNDARSTGLLIQLLDLNCPE